jgi:hypothetical protein
MQARLIFFADACIFNYLYLLLRFPLFLNDRPLKDLLVFK